MAHRPVRVSWSSACIEIRCGRIQFTRIQTFSVFLKLNKSRRYRLPTPACDVRRTVWRHGATKIQNGERLCRLLAVCLLRIWFSNSFPSFSELLLSCFATSTIGHTRCRAYPYGVHTMDWRMWTSHCRGSLYASKWTCRTFRTNCEILNFPSNGSTLYRIGEFTRLPESWPDSLTFCWSSSAVCLWTTVVFIRFRLPSFKICFRTALVLVDCEIFSSGTESLEVDWCTHVRVAHRTRWTVRTLLGDRLCFG